jgi:MFS family permease
MPYWQRLFSTGYRDAKGDLNITTAQESGIVSILSAGTFFGALSSPFMTDYIGRRPGLMIATWVFNLGVALHLFPCSWLADSLLVSVLVRFLLSVSLHNTAMRGTVTDTV